MDHFSLVDGAMHCEGVPLSVIAEAVGTPVYVYSTATLKRHARVFREGLAGAGDVHLAYAIKANPNLAVLRVMADAGYGADVVSGGELARALAAGVPGSGGGVSGGGQTVTGMDTALGAGVRNPKR